MDISLNNRFHLDEFNISSFCPNTLKALNNKTNKFKLFKNHLHTFHNNEEFYEDDLNSYLAFITYSILIKCLKENKNLASFETYFFNIIEGYCKVNTIVFNINSIAKYWINISTVYQSILKVVSNDLIKNIIINEMFFTSFKHINVSKKMLDNYYFNIPIILEFEDKIDALIIIPNTGQNIYSNLLVLSVINYFNNKINNLFIINIDINKFKVEMISLNISTILLSKCFKIIETLYIDFKKVNIFNCNICPLSCSTSEILDIRYEPTPFGNKKRIIETRDI